MNFKIKLKTVKLKCTNEIRIIFEKFIKLSKINLKMSVLVIRLRFYFTRECES